MPSTRFSFLSVVALFVSVSSKHAQKGIENLNKNHSSPLLISKSGKKPDRKETNII